MAMRDRTEIEREMFHAREDLEQNVDRLAHKIREQVAVPARVRHAVGGAAREHLAVLITGAAIASVVIGLMILWRARHSA
jgi:hypothetical protein